MTPEVASSDLKASVDKLQYGFAIQGFEELRYEISIMPSVFSLSPENTLLASLYKPYGRCLLVTDQTVDKLYNQMMREYFQHHGIPLKIFAFPGGETHKNPETLFSITEAFNNFGLLRKEPVLIVGGGLVTDVAGFACAMFRRNAQYIRIPTSLVGLIDAGISIKVGVNMGKYKNRIGAFHAPLKTLLDFNFLKTLDEGQIRNGMAELLKITSVTDIKTWKLLAKYGKCLVETRFGRLDGANQEILKAADKICQRVIAVTLELETPNLQEVGLDRPMRLGHIWSVTLELATPIPLRHGHAVAIDMAYTATLCCMRGYIDEAQRDEIIGTLASVGLSVDHEAFDEKLLVEATAEILQIHDGKQRFPAYRPLGSCFFINDATVDELRSALILHKYVIRLMFPETRGSQGVDAYVDEVDLGYNPMANA